MRASKTKTLIAAAAALVGAATLSAPAAQAGVTSCAATGGKQEAGALIGAALGGLLGNSISGHNRTTGTVVGAAVGAAAGSAVGCQMQHGDPARRPARDGRYGYERSSYVSGGYRLSSQIEPARFSRIGQTFVVTRDFGLRAAPEFSSRYVGKLRGGERVEAMARVRGTEWILVGRDGVGFGYVHDDYVRPAGHRYAYGY